MIRSRLWAVSKDGGGPSLTTSVFFGEDMDDPTSASSTGYDGAKLWLRKQWSTGFMMMRTLNVPFWRRGKVEYTKRIAMWPGPCEPDYFKMRDTFLAHFIEEMIKID